MSRQDPYAKYGGSVDPYAKYGGAVSTEEPPGGPPGTTLVNSSPSQIASGMITGIGKGAARFGLSAAQWAEHLLGTKVTPTPMSLAPRTPVEAIGGKLPEFALPIAAGVMTGGASVPIQAAVGGLASALAASSEGASPAATTTAGVLGAAGPEMSNVLSGPAKWMRGKARELVAAAIGPREKEKEGLSKVIDEITRRRPLALSSEGLLAKFKKAADKATADFDQLFSKAEDLTPAELRQIAREVSAVANNWKVGVSPHLTGQEAQKAGDELAKIAGEIRSLSFRPGPWQRLTSRQDLPAPVIPGKHIPAPAEEIRKLKQQYDAVMQGTSGNFYRTLAEGSRAEAAEEGFYKLREGMIRKVPELQKAGREAQIAITPRNILARREISDISGGMGKIGLGAELGLLATGLGFQRVEPVAAAVTLSVLRHALASTPRKLLTAAAYTTLSNAIEKGNVNVAMKIVGQTPAVLETLKKDLNLDAR